MASKKTQEPTELERYIHPEEAAMAAHHVEMYHNIKEDKHLHKAAKDHIKGKHEKLSKILGKTEEKMKPAVKKPAAKAKGKK